MHFLYNLLIGPLEFVFEIVFTACYRITNNWIISLLGLSLVVSFVTLPLYNRADFYQEEERKKQRKMEGWLKKIRETFGGDESYFMVQAYYKEQNYKPYYAIRNSVSLILQIPFFMAAYNYLSGIKNVGSTLFDGPDKWLKVGGITLNVLPIIMTVINLIAGYVYSKGMTWKEKWQIYVLPMVFLVLLYNSKAGLVVYWIFNNVFSLVKNIVKKYDKKGFVKTYIICFAYLSGMVLLGYLAKNTFEEMRKKADYIKYVTWAIIFVIYNLPLVCLELRKKKLKAKGLPEPEESETTVPAYESDKTVSKSAKSKSGEKTKIGGSVVFFFEAILAALFGLYVPYSIIASSPVEFLKDSFADSYKIVDYSFVLSLGMFFVWFNVIYVMLDEKAKAWFKEIMFILTVYLLSNYFVWGKNYGTVNVFLRYDLHFRFAWWLVPLSFGLLFVEVIVLHFIWKHFARIIKDILPFVLIAMLVVTGYNMHKVDADMKEQQERLAGGWGGTVGSFQFSKNGKNVLVIMLDRAIGAYVPYIMEDHPELYDQYDGFTYYPNSVSMGGFTNVGSPEIFGGYEYMPSEMDARDDTLLSVDHDHALKVMPVLFEEAGYNIMLSDLPYAGYTWVSDMSVFNEYPNMRTYNFEAVYDTQLMSADVTSIQRRNFLGYGLFKTMPPFLQCFVYDGGGYLTQRDIASSARPGARSYKMLADLAHITGVDNSDNNNLIMFDNNITHEEDYYQLPDYTLTNHIDNSGYDFPTSKTVNGVTMLLEDEQQIMHYHVNSAALLRLGEWFEFLKEEGVYDNTRIIIVSDHGRRLNQFKDMIINADVDVEAYNCLLMVKDFDATGFTVDDQFMTNADTPSIAMEGLIENPVNPFTGNPINTDRKYGDPLPVTLTEKWGAHDGYKFDTSDKPWYTVHDDIFDPNNWVKIKDAGQ